MNAEILQLRKSFSDSINRNPSFSVYFLNGILKSEKVRLVHEAASVPSNKTTPVGLGTSFSMFCKMKFDSPITENTVLIIGSDGWKMGPIDDLKHKGKIYGKRSPLTKVTLSTSNKIISAKIGSVAGVINNTNHTIVFTLPVGTDVTALTPNIDHNGKMITPVGAQDFSVPKVYQVTAENLSIQSYTLSVVLA